MPAPVAPITLTAAGLSPDRADRATFVARSIARDDFIKNTQIPQLQTAITNVYNNSLEAYNSGVSATADAASSAINASAAASAATATQWVSGTTYVVGDARWSPVTKISYRRLIAGAGTTDPSADATNWGLIFAQLAGTRNVIINGAMGIDQRNAGALVNPAINGEHTLDRWRAISGAASKFSIGRNAGGVTLPVGFSHYLGTTSLSAYAVAAGENFAVRHNVEGFSTSQFAWGTASAKSVTLSFWVRSSLTGTFGLVLRNSAQNRTYPATYTITAANTWEQKSVVIAGDTSGTWLVDNSTGVELQFNLGAGSTVSGGTVGAWNAGSFQAPAGVVSVVGTLGATLYVTGVQLEAGTVATPFEQRLYGTELALCQRYYEILGFIFMVAASTHFPCGFWAVSKRTSPTLVVTAGGTGATVTVLANALTSGFYQNTNNSSDTNGVVAGSAEL